MHKLIPIALLLLGETLAIYAELIAAKGRLVVALVWGFPATTALILGYYLGYKTTNNIWAITAMSIGSICVAEPVLILMMFHQAPTRNALLALFLGVFGIIIASR